MKKLTLIVIILAVILSQSVIFADEGLSEIKIINTAISQNDTLHLFFNVTGEDDEKIDIKYNDIDLTITDSNDTAVDYTCDGLKSYDNFGTCYILLFDVSNSNKKIDEMKKSAISLVQNLDKQDIVSIITFGDEVTICEKFSNDKDILEKTILNIDTTDKWTKLYSAIFTALKYTSTYANNIPTKKSIILYSDGINYDDGGKVTHSDIVNMLRTTSRSMPIYGIQFDTKNNSTKKDKITQLRNIIKTSNGELITYAGNSIKTCYDKIQQSIESYYFLDIELSALAGDYTITLKSRHNDTNLEDSFNFILNKDINMSLQPTHTQSTDNNAIDDNEANNDITSTEDNDIDSTNKNTNIASSSFFKNKNFIYYLIPIVLLMLIIILLYVRRNYMIENKKANSLTVFLKPFKDNNVRAKCAFISDQLLIGASSKKCDLAYSSKCIKKVHFVLEYKDNKLYIFNYQLGYQTFVNGYELNSKRELRSGDIIAFGDIEVEIIFHS